MDCTGTDNQKQGIKPLDSTTAQVKHRNLPS